MINLRIITKEEQDIVVRVEDDIRVAQNVLYDNDLLYDEDSFNLNRVREALIYGAYHDDVCYITQGMDILKEFIQNAKDFETEDYNYFNDCIDTLQTIVDSHTK